MIITFLFGKIILGGYWLIFAPALFLPLGTVLLSRKVLRGSFGYVVLLLAIAFAAALGLGKVDGSLKPLALAPLGAWQ